MSYALTISTIARCVYFYVVVLNEACPNSHNVDAGEP